MIPGWGQFGPGGSLQRSADDVLTTFYEHFDDVYDSVALIGHQTVPVWFTAGRSSVKSEVGGIGRRPYDNSQRYGTSFLKGIESYQGPDFAWDWVSKHEMGHQWGHFWDWEAIASIEHPDRVHGPRWMYPSEKAVGGLFHYWDVVPTEGDSSEGFEVRFGQPPVEYHPLQLYAMGLLSPAELPEFVLFEDQAQNAIPGDTLQGPIQTIHINDIIAVHGTRSGPVADGHRRATIIVSADRLASQRVMDYWNFISQRHAADAGAFSYGGFFEATGERVRLTRIIRRGSQ